MLIENLLVMFRHAASTAPAMFASQRPPGQAKYTKVLVVKFPLVKKLGDNGSLLVPTSKLRNEAGVFNHGVDIEIGCQTEEDREQDVQNRG